MNLSKNKGINIDDESKIAIDDYNIKKISINIYY